MTSFLPIILIFFHKRTLRYGTILSEIQSKQALMPISWHVNRKKYLMLVLPIITMIFKKRTSQLPLWSNSFENPVRASTYFRKSYPIRIIATSVFWKKIVMIGKNDVKYLLIFIFMCFNFNYLKIRTNEILPHGQLNLSNWSNPQT